MNESVVISDFTYPRFLEIGSFSQRLSEAGRARPRHHHQDRSTLYNGVLGPMLGDVVAIHSSTMQPLPARTPSTVTATEEMWAADIESYDMLA